MTTQPIAGNANFTSVANRPDQLPYLNVADLTSVQISVDTLQSVVNGLSITSNTSKDSGGGSVLITADSNATGAPYSNITLTAPNQVAIVTTQVGGAGANEVIIQNGDGIVGFFGGNGSTKAGAITNPTNEATNTVAIVAILTALRAYGLVTP